MIGLMSLPLVHPRRTLAEVESVLKRPPAGGGAHGSGLGIDADASGRIVHREVQLARSAEFGCLDEPLPTSLQRCMPEGGLWSHQAEAINLIRAGASVVIATGTASGKSLGYQLPIAEATLDATRPGTSLLVYPTKALAHDQVRSFEALDIDTVVARSYDGDTDRKERVGVRQRANTVLTNPEMLHYGILPYHRKWAGFLRRLRYVVVDELHTYRGVFGSHLAHVLRRLRRLCALHGSDPAFIFTSATIGEPEKLATDLCGKAVVPVTVDGSPRGDRHLSLVAPALLDAATGRRQSAASETIRVVTELVLDGRRVIAFCPSRSTTERVAAGVQQALPVSLRESVRPYRAGYLSAERRAIEDELSSGQLRAVITTSALELGVDIGTLDATVLCGFPGTIASMWQQIGRAGRANQDSVAVLIAGDNQLDQWYVSHPEALFTRAAEPAVINPHNPFLVDPHLRCAAFEAPLHRTDEVYWTEIDEGVRRGVLADHLRVRSSQLKLPTAVWAGRGVPAPTVGLRSTAGRSITIRSVAGETIGTSERAQASSQIHPGADYVHRGQHWRVVELDLNQNRALVEPSPGETWTRPITTIDLEVCTTTGSRAVGSARVNQGEVLVTNQVTGFQRRAASSGDLIEASDLDLPPEQLRTTAVWYEWPTPWPRQHGIDRVRLPGALHALEHCAIGILPLFAICDRWDVGGVSITSAPHSGQPSVFIYDGYPGGAGIAELAFEKAEAHLHATLEVLSDCACRAGCPSCVQSPKCGNGNEPLEKEAARALLEQTLQVAEPF